MGPLDADRPLRSIPRVIMPLTADLPRQYSRCGGIMIGTEDLYMTHVLSIDGEVAAPRDLTFRDLRAMEGQIEDVGGVVSGRRGGAVSLAGLLDLAGSRDTAVILRLESCDGYRAEVPLRLLSDAVVAYRLGEEPLPQEEGGPIRFLIPDAAACKTAQTDACSNVKSLERMTLLSAPEEVET